MVKPKKDINRVTEKIGEFTLSAIFKEPQGLHATTCAAINLFQAKIRDDLKKDDYTLSLEKLLDLLDTYLKEQYHSSGGDLKRYNLLDNGDVTLCLLWQIRNIRHHHGGVVDDNCKQKYEDIFSTAKSRGISPIIEMPDKLEIDHTFDSLTLEEYKIIEEACFKIIEHERGIEDTTILRTRSSVGEFKFGLKVRLPMTGIDGHDYLIELEVGAASKFGIEFNMLTGKYLINRQDILHPDRSTCKFYPDDPPRIFDMITSEGLPVKIIKRL